MKETKSRANLEWFLDRLVPISVLIASSLVVFMMRQTYEHYPDMHWHQSQAEKILEWNDFSLNLGSNPLYHFGTQLPVSPYLSPTFLIASFFPPQYKIAVEGGVQALLLAIIFIWIGRMCALRFADASAIAMIAIVYLYSFTLTTGGALAGQTLLGLIWQDAAIAVLLTSIFFFKIGETSAQGRKNNLWPIFGMYTCVTWFLLTYPALTPFYFLTTAAVGFGILLTCQNRNEIFLKLGAVVALGIVLLFVGFHSYLEDIFNYTPQMFFKSLQGTSFENLLRLNTSILLVPVLVGKATYKFFAIAALGAAMMWHFGTPTIKRFSKIAILFELSVFLMSALNSFLKKLALSFYYVELMGISLVALLAASAWWIAVNYPIKVAKGKNRWVPQTVLTVAPYLFLIFMVGRVLSHDSNNPTFSSWPPTKTGATQAVIRETAIQPGQNFRGRAAVILSPDRFQEVLSSYHKYLGYNFLTDLMGDNVPLTNEYGHWTSPATLVTSWAAFGDPTKPIERAARPLYLFNPKLARLFGVSTVISDNEIAGEEKLFGGEAGKFPIGVYKISETNLGQYSPIQTVKVNTAKEILDVLQSPKFDGQKMAITEENMDDQLVPVKNVSVKLLKGPKVHIEAETSGISLLVLPFDFSYCLEPNGAGLKKIIPVNLSQIGLLIQGKADVKIGYRYGLFKGTSCRHHDRERLLSLNLDSAANGRLFLK